jgi:hypothetical protein
MSDILARMRQLVGSTAAWAANDIVIGDGEIVFERIASGRARMKIGDGINLFSELEYVDGLIPAFGEDYTWQNKTASRTDNNDYVGPDHPIFITYQAEFLSDGGTCAIVVSGLQVAAAANGGNGAMIQTLSAIVPPGETYRVNTASLNGRIWLELRAD